MPGQREKRTGIPGNCLPGPRRATTALLLPGRSHPPRRGERGRGPPVPSGAAEQSCAGTVRLLTAGVRDVTGVEQLGDGEGGDVTGGRAGTDGVVADAAAHPVLAHWYPVPARGFVGKHRFGGPYRVLLDTACQSPGSGGQWFPHPAAAGYGRISEGWRGPPARTPVSHP